MNMLIILLGMIIFGIYKFYNNLSNSKSQKIKIKNHENLILIGKLLNNEQLQEN
jgi:hypothetical protein